MKSGFLSAILVASCGLGPLVHAATPPILTFPPLRARSTQWVGEAAGDLAAQGQAAWFVPDSGNREVAWKAAVAGVTERLGRLGLVPVPKAEFSQFPGALSLEAKALALSNPFLLVFRPKDSASFNLMAGQVELLGDRELGPAIYDLRGCACFIKGSFQFTDKGCRVLLGIQGRVYGDLVNDDGSLGRTDLIPEEWMDLSRLMDRVRKAIEPSGAN